MGFVRFCWNHVISMQACQSDFITDQICVYLCACDIWIIKDFFFVRFLLKIIDFGMLTVYLDVIIGVLYAFGELRF